MESRVILVAFLAAFALVATGAAITTAKQVHDHRMAALERSRN
jgi:hypothetical protein